MPRYSIPEPKRGWQRAHQTKRTNGGGVSKSHLHYSTQSNGKLAVQVTGNMDSLARLNDDSFSRPGTADSAAGTAPSNQQANQDLLLVRDELDETQSALAESKKLVEELRGLLDQRETELVRCQGELKKSTKSVKTLERQVEQFSSQTQQLQNRITELENQPAQVVSDPLVEEKIKKLEVLNASLQGTIESQKESSTTILGMISSYQKKLEEAEKTINAQNDELQAIRQENERLVAGIQDKSDSHTPVRRHTKPHVCPSPARGILLNSVELQPQSPPKLRKGNREMFRGEVASPASSVGAGIAVDAMQAHSSARSGGLNVTGQTRALGHARGTHTASKKRQADEGTHSTSSSKRLSAELRQLHSSNAEHLVDTTLLSPANVRRMSGAGKKRSPPLKTPPGSDPLARLDDLFTKKQLSSSTSSKRSVNIEIASHSDDDSDSSGYSSS